MLCATTHSEPVYEVEGVTHYCVANMPGAVPITATKALMQIQQGTAVPVTHGTTPLQADGTLLGRRLAALIALRDHARRVLQSQNEGWPEGQRQTARGRSSPS